MPLIHAVILALVQAATEFLPVSSTAHLILVPWLMGWEDHGLLFDIALHLGTLLAVLVYFAKTWIRLLFLALGRRVLAPDPGDPDRDLYANPKLFWYLVAATFPAGIAGLLLKDYVETVFRSPFVVGFMLIAIGLVLAWAERAGTFRRDLGHVSFLDAMIIGCAQAVALIPGTSRSGITISAALFRGVERAAAARFSFLLSSPIILGATAKTAFDVWGQGGIPPEMQLAFLTGIAVSAVSGYAVIALFIRYLQTRTLRIFIYYRIIFGIIVLALASFFRLPTLAP
jgi:undecaprenyl-diphosphatase